ncbi:MAG: DNA-binding response regulator [Betaproteobacteria bacterium]|jgi:DNA-binding response OmpR family regulator|nr:DNA-binding response regulator [Betaproteobacteria bacterium]
MANTSEFVVALVEDDRLLREEISSHLLAHGFEVHAVNSATALDDLMARTPVDLYILDLNLPGEGGLSLCRRLRQTLPNAGIAILTARVSLNDRLAGYEMGGADIYLTKPVAPDELVMVLRSLGRRINKNKISHDWSLNLRDRTLKSPHAESKLRLTNREKILLVALIQAKENTLESGALCDLYTGDESDDLMSKHALEELVARLRKKLRSALPEGAEQPIKSVWGVGYQLCIPVEFGH